MEEKERYELFGKHYIKDNNPDVPCQLLDKYVTCIILNEQDKRIKELEATNKVLSNELTKNNIIKQDRLETCCGIPIYEISTLKEENQQLKEELKKYKSYKTDDERIKDLTGLYEKYTTENQQLKQQLKNEKNTSAELVSLIDTMRYEDPKINELEHQLHDLPKKIVCEISEAIERLSWRKRIYTNWEFDKEQLYKDLYTILKKFGGEDE